MSRFNDPFIHLIQGGFYESGEEGRADHERWNGSQHAIRNTHKRFGNRDHRNDQDNERNRTQDVHNERQDRVTEAYHTGCGSSGHVGARQSAVR